MVVSLENQTTKGPILVPMQWIFSILSCKQMSILQAPNILVIQLKRFEDILVGEIDKAVAFEEVLVLSSFMCKASQDPLSEYKFFDTIVHSGYSLESSHYYAYIKDAMGQWYCCDYSCVTLATLQEVLSEKVYILFFSPTNQRPVSFSNSLSSNGGKPRHSNGSQVSECPKVDVPLKAVHAKSFFEQSHWKDMPSVSKVGKRPSSSQVKFEINGNSISKRSLAPASVNGKVVVSKNHSLVINGHVKDTVSSENGKKDPSSLPTRNGFERNKVYVTDNFEQENNGFKHKPEIFGNKRKVLESLEYAMKRGVPIIAEYLGGVVNYDAYHLTNPRVDGLGVSSCNSAPTYANVSLEEVNYINAHATSTPVGDLAEINAITKVFKNTSSITMKAITTS